MQPDLPDLQAMRELIANPSRVVPDDGEAGIVRWIARADLVLLERERAAAYDRGLAEGRRQATEGWEREWGTLYAVGQADFVRDHSSEAAARERAERIAGLEVVSRLVGPWEPDEQPEPIAVEQVSAETIASVLGVVDAPYRPGLNVEFDDEQHEEASQVPESVCHRCHGPNIPWSAPSPLWNAVMRGGSIGGTDEFDGIVCPTCFAVLAQQRGVAELWRFSAERVHAVLATTSPDGRVWNAERWLWVEPASGGVVEPSDPQPARRQHDPGALIEEPDLYGEEADHA